MNADPPCEHGNKSDSNELLFLYIVYSLRTFLKHLLSFSNIRLLGFNSISELSNCTFISAETVQSVVFF